MPILWFVGQAVEDNCDRKARHKVGRCCRTGDAEGDSVQCNPNASKVSPALHRSVEVDSFESKGRHEKISGFYYTAIKGLKREIFPHLLSKHFVFTFQLFSPRLNNMSLFSSSHILFLCLEKLRSMPRTVLSPQLVWLIFIFDPSLEIKEEIEQMKAHFPGFFKST